MTERVTVEQNGERFTLEVPDGASDDDIHKFISSQQNVQPNIQQMLSSPPDPAGNIGAAIAGTVRPTIQTYLEKSPMVANARDAVNVAQNVANRVSPAGLQEMASNPYQTAKAFVQGMPAYKYMANPSTILPAVGSTAGRIAGGMLTAPENTALLPYNMAAYEQEKIRQNPNAPGLEYNPYAQVQRGEFKNQGQAGEMNRKYSMIGQQYGGLTEEQQNVLQTDRISKLMRLKAAQKVLAPVQPNQ